MATLTASVMQVRGSVSHCSSGYSFFICSRTSFAIALMRLSSSSGLKIEITKAHVTVQQHFLGRNARVGHPHLLFLVGALIGIN
jgi:hypothetical protein